MEEIKHIIGYSTELYEFRTHYTVHCPGCEKKAILTNKNLNYWISGRISCTNCAFFKDFNESTSYRITANDGTSIGSKIVTSSPNPLHIKLWYAAYFRENSFWALNENHLQFLFDFIAAKHRVRNINEMRNRSIGSRLPTWMTSSSNREDLIKLIEKMM